MVSESFLKRLRFDPKQTFAALKYPNYRRWFVGQMVSLVGTWMQTTAQSFLIFELTKSTTYLGYVGFASGLPTWVFMLYAGTVADRFPRRTLLIITQSVMMGLAFILAGLAFTNTVQPWHIIALAFLLGIANAFDAPARVSFTLEMVEREDLTNAIALNATMFNTATAVGPAVAGMAYAVLGPAWCFTINGFSFIAVILALLSMRLKPMPSAPRKASAQQEVTEGLTYVAQHTVIRSLILLMAGASLFGLSFVTLFPAWSTEVLQGDAVTNGYLQSARGVGALIAALIIASLGRFTFKGRMLTIGSLCYPVVILIFAQMRWLPLSLVMLVGAGWAMITMFNISNALMQSLSPDHLRGRVASIFTFSFFGMVPVGALIAGTLAQLIGPANTVTLSASIALGISLFVFWRVPQVRATP